MAEQHRFVWYDLLTTDLEAAITFYTEVVGWKTRGWDGPQEYTMLVAGDSPMGGIMKTPLEDAPPHWIGYLGASDVDQAAARVVELGGKVLHEATDIPETGRFAVVADPQGAAFALFAPKGEQEPPADRPPALGDVSWHELYTTDYEAAWRFYSELAGWKATESFDMGPEMGTYFMFESAGPRPLRGGMANVAKTHGFPPCWSYYVSVEDVDAAAERIASAGGTVINGPMEVPGGDRIVQAKDPQGAVFALHSAMK